MVESVLVVIDTDHWVNILMTLRTCGFAAHVLSVEDCTAPWAEALCLDLSNLPDDVPREMAIAAFIESHLSEYEIVVVSSTWWDRPVFLSRDRFERDITGDLRYEVAHDEVCLQLSFAIRKHDTPSPTDKTAIREVLECLYAEGAREVPMRI